MQIWAQVSFEGLGVVLENFTIGGGWKNVYNGDGESFKQFFHQSLNLMHGLHQQFDSLIKSRLFAR